MEERKSEKGGGREQVAGHRIGGRGVITFFFAARDVNSLTTRERYIYIYIHRKIEREIETARQRKGER